MDHDPGVSVDDNPRRPAGPGRIRSWLRVSGSVGTLGIGTSVLWLSIIVLLPLAALTAKSFEDGWSGFWDAITAPGALDALKVTVFVSIIVTLINVVMGTLIAWVLVRDEFPGKGFVNALIDLPFALPTIVASIVLLALYGPQSPFDIHLNATQPGLVVALAFVTLPFVVREVEPVLHEIGDDQEQAAATLGASGWQTFWRITLPAIRWGLTYGIVLTVARALGEFGAVIMVSTGLPGKSQTLTLLVNGRYVNDHNTFGAYCAATLLMGIALVVLLLMTLLERKRGTAK
ncbi:sulfate ABC transporter permease subunit [Nocardia seriolae]|nr:sulfate ABC transporter permease subunit [Nocardia seriolae]